MACLFLAVLEWAHVPWHEHLQAAKFIVAGEVVEIAPDSTGRSIAKLKVDRVLKGKCGDAFLSLPFKPERTWGCDYPIEYEMKKYLLCIDDRNFFRVIHYPAYVSRIIPDYGAPAVRFTKAIVANDIPALGRVGPDVLEAIRGDDPEVRSIREELELVADLRR